MPQKAARVILLVRFNHKPTRETMTLQILFCESEPMLHDLVAEYLSPLGFKITVAQNDIQCLQTLEKKLPDVILLDTHLHSSGGAQIVTKIREKGLKVPVLLLASNYGVTSKEEAISLGANGFIEKPFRLKDILEQTLNLMPN